MTFTDWEFWLFVLIYFWNVYFYIRIVANMQFNQMKIQPMFQSCYDCSTISILRRAEYVLSVTVITECHAIRVYFCLNTRNYDNEALFYCETGRIYFCICLSFGVQ